MPSRETLITFREGLKAIQTVDDYATLKDTIIRMMAFTTPEDAHFARDAIARTIRKKQAVELQRYQGYPQQIANLDQKYRDLAIVLAKAKTAPPKPVAVTPKPKPAPAPAPEKKPERDTKKQMVKASAFNGLNAPLMVMNWIKSRKKTIVLGTALASSIGGLYWMYKFLTKDEDEKGKKKNPEEKESGFDKTIRSIQRYRAFTQASKDPDFMGDYEALVSGKEIPVRKKVKKKPELDKTTEWEQEERSLMKNMDSAFNAIGTKPKVNYALPQLPEPRDIDPSSVIELTRGKKEEAPVLEKPKKKKRRKPKPKPKPAETTTLSVGPSMPTPAPKPKPKSRKKNPQPKEAAPKPKPKPKKASKPKKVAEKPAGRLIPIVKRTKRVKKVRA